MIHFARPGRETLSWLAKAIGEAQHQDPFAPVTFVVPSVDLGRELQLALAKVAKSYVNVRYIRLAEVATKILASPAMGTEASSENIALGAQPRTLTTSQELSAIRAALAEVTADDRAPGRVLRATRRHRSLHIALRDLFRDIRSRDSDLQRIRGSQASATVRGAVAVYDRYRHLTAECDDAVSLAQGAVARLHAEATLSDIQLPLRRNEELGVRAVVRAFGTIIFIAPARLDRADAELISALQTYTPVLVLLPRLDDPRGFGDDRARGFARTLTDGDRVPVAELPIPDVLLLKSNLTVIRATDPAEEVREAIRRVLLTSGDRAPLHRTAILYRQRDPYARLIADTLTQAGVPWVDLAGTFLAATRTGRAFCALLRMTTDDLARTSVLAWAETSPTVRVGSTGEPVTIDPATWDYISRESSVVRGVDHWVGRVTAFALRCEREADSLVAINEGVREAKLRLASDARQIVGVIEALMERCAPQRLSFDSMTAVADWALALRRDFVGTDGTAPTIDGLIDAVLTRLPEANPFDQGADGAVDVILATLETTSATRNRLGTGVVVGPIDRVPLVPFDHVLILGMIEGSFPPPTATDPFFPTMGDDPLHRRDALPASERAAFLTAVALADGGELLLGTPDSVGGRTAFPSRWLLAFAEARHGAPIRFARDLHNLAVCEPALPWLHHRMSAHDGARRAAETAPLHREDRRLGSFVSMIDARVSVHAHPLAHVAGGPSAGLAQSQRMASARAVAQAFTAWDGNVAEVRHSRTLTRTLRGPLSATRIETWATCPFRSLLKDVLRVPVTRTADDVWGIDALERGTVIHAILEEWYRAEATNQPRQAPARGSVSNETDEKIGDHVAALANRHFADLEARGVVGYRVAWQALRAEIIDDVREFIVADEARRMRTGMVPSMFEQWFGPPSSHRPVAAPWPAVEVTGVNLARVSFRGGIDRVDRHMDGRSAEVIDYKSGSAESYRGLDNDPVLAGRAIQLALYRRAVIESLGVADVAATYRFTSGQSAGRIVGIVAHDERVDRRLAEVVAVVAEGITSGSFPQVPGPDDKNCTFCDYRRVCPTNLDDVRDRTRSTALGSLHDRLMDTGSPADADPGSDDGDDE